MKHETATERYGRMRGRTLGLAATLLGGGLLASASAAAQTPGPAAPVPFDQVEGLPRRPPPLAGSAPAEELPDLSAEGWRLAPIRWSGNSATTLNSFRDHNGGGTVNNIQTLTLRSASHIYQPWLAQVNGNLGLMSGTTHRKLPDNTAADNNDVRSTSLTYGGSLNLFPVSRFPFQAYLDHGDSRVSSNSLGSQYTSTRIGLRQSYRPPVGTENYALSYDRSVLAADSGRSVVDSLQGNYSVALADHSIAANTRISQNTGGFNGEASRLMSATGSHIWRVEDGLTVSSTANFSDQQLRYLSSGVLSTNNNRLMQANSTFTWLPDEDLPLTVIGGGNLLSIETQTDAASNRFINLGGFLGLTYRFSSRLIGSGNFQLSQTQSGASRYLLAGGNGTISYTGTPLTIGNFNYNWNAAANGSIQTISSGASLQGATGQVGHGLTRAIVFSPANLLNLTLSQSVSLGTNSQTGASSTLSHSGGISWRLGYGDRLTGMFSAIVSDNLTTGQYSGHYRSIGLNGNGLTQLSRRAAITANANITWSQQKQQTGQQLQLGSQVFDTGTSQWNGSASLGYNHFSPFNIANLLYTISAQYSSSQVNQRILNGDPNALSWQITRSIQQRAIYRLGRLSFQFLNAFATVNGKKNASIFFQVSRDFGDL